MLSKIFYIVTRIMGPQCAEGARHSRAAIRCVEGVIYVLQVRRMLTL